MVVLLGLGDLGIFVLARSKAQTAADAAALAAAAELLPGSAGEPRDQARRFANANGAQLLECACTKGSESVLVRVGVEVHFGIIPGPRDVTARARASVEIARFRGRAGGGQ